MGFETATPPKVETQKPVIDMDPILERVPPIEGVFSPDEEVQKLWSVPKTERREAVASFKDKLARQREAWALCRTSIEERIESNPDLAREEMVGIINEFASYYGFAEAHIETAKSLVDDYIEMHKRVAETREKYPDNIALINRVTGMKFTQADAEDFVVTVGPMSIEITCSGFNCGRICEKSKDPIVGFEYGGFASMSADSKPVYYLVVNKDYATKDPYFHATTAPHEREHQKNKILIPRLYGTREVRADVREMLNQGVLGFLRSRLGERLLGFERNFEGEIYEKYESTKDPEEKAFLLEEYMRLKRESALDRAKDEIIARKVEPAYSRHTYNVFLEQNGDVHDYLAYLRDCDKKKDDLLWQETSQRVLVDEYRDIIDRAIAAFDGLRNNGYSQKEVIAMLSDKRLPDWPKTVRRLLAQREKNE